MKNLLLCAVLVLSVAQPLFAADPPAAPAPQPTAPKVAEGLMDKLETQLDEVEIEIKRAKELVSSGSGDLKAICQEKFTPEAMAQEIARDWYPEKGSVRSKWVQTPTVVSEMIGQAKAKTSEGLMEFHRCRTLAGQGSCADLRKWTTTLFTKEEGDRLVKDCQDRISGLQSHIAQYMRKPPFFLEAIAGSPKAVEACKGDKKASKGGRMDIFKPGTEATACPLLVQNWSNPAAACKAVAPYLSGPPQETKDCELHLKCVSGDPTAKAALKDLAAAMPGDKGKIFLRDCEHYADFRQAWTAKNKSLCKGWGPCVSYPGDYMTEGALPSSPDGKNMKAVKAGLLSCTEDDAQSHINGLKQWYCSRFAWPAFSKITADAVVEMENKFRSLRDQRMELARQRLKESTGVIQEVLNHVNPLDQKKVPERSELMARLNSVRSRHERLFRDAQPGPPPKVQPGPKPPADQTAPAPKKG